MLHILFGGLMGMALLWGLIQGEGERVVSAVLSGAEDGITTALSLAGGFAFFCGLMEELRRSGAVTRLARRFAPALAWLLGGEVPGDALDYVALNFSANLLGLGNACPYYKGNYTRSDTFTYFGEALAVVRANGAGPLKVTVSDGDTTRTETITCQE